MKRHEWTHGQKAELAKAAGLTPSHLSNILAKGTCGPELALALEKATNAVKGLPPVGRMIWLYGPRENNPLVGTQEFAKEALHD